MWKRTKNGVFHRFFFFLFEAGHHFHPVTVFVAPSSLSHSQTPRPWRSAQKVNETTLALEAEVLNWFHTHVCAHSLITHLHTHTHTQNLWLMNGFETFLALLHKKNRITWKWAELDSFLCHEPWMNEQVAQIWHHHGNNKFTNCMLPCILQKRLNIQGCTVVKDIKTDKHNCTFVHPWPTLFKTPCSVPVWIEAKIFMTLFSQWCVLFTSDYHQGNNG